MGMNHWPLAAVGLTRVVVSYFRAAGSLVNRALGRPRPAARQPLYIRGIQHGQQPAGDSLLRRRCYLGLQKTIVQASERLPEVPRPFPASLPSILANGVGNRFRGWPKSDGDSMARVRPGKGSKALTAGSNRLSNQHDGLPHIRKRVAGGSESQLATMAQAKERLTAELQAAERKHEVLMRTYVDMKEQLSSSEACVNVLADSLNNVVQASAASLQQLSSCQATNNDMIQQMAVLVMHSEALQAAMDAAQQAELRSVVVAAEKGLVVEQATSVLHAVLMAVGLPLNVPIHLSTGLSIEPVGQQDPYVRDLVPLVVAALADSGALGSALMRLSATDRWIGMASLLS